MEFWPLTRKFGTQNSSVPKFDIDVFVAVFRICWLVKVTFKYVVFSYEKKITFAFSYAGIYKVHLFNVYSLNL